MRLALQFAILHLQPLQFQNPVVVISLLPELVLLELHGAIISRLTLETITVTSLKSSVLRARREGGIGKEE